MTRIPIIEVHCVTYNQPGPLKVLVQSFLNQTSSNWKLSVCHDSPSDAFDESMHQFKIENPDRAISYACTLRRYNDFGHSLRHEGIRHSTGDYLLLTNGDNYYVPRFIELVTEAIIQDPSVDVVFFDMVHSHDNPGGRGYPPYSYFKTSFERYSIDIGAFVVRSSLARQVGFRDKSFAGDATYAEDILRAAKTPVIRKLDRVLFVHN
jgi:glycosyltransferase involved in cell wall biosynthesis